MNAKKINIKLFFLSLVFVMSILILAGVNEFSVNQKGSSPLYSNDLRLSDEDQDSFFNNLKIGGFVDYTPKTDSSEYVFQAKYTGADDDQTFERENLDTWRIMSINKTNRTIDITSGKPTSVMLTLKGAQGYNNGVYLLNDMTNKLYSNSDLNAIARSFSEMDLIANLKDNSYTNYAIFDDENNETYRFGKVVNYDKKGTYPVQWLNDDADTESTYIETLSKSRNLVEPENVIGGSFNSPISARGSIYEFSFSDDFKTYSDSQIIKVNNDKNVLHDIFMFGDDYRADDFWLATRMVNTKSSDQVVFGLRFMSGGVYVTGLGGSSNWWSGNGSHRIRPVVTIPFEAFDTTVTGRTGTKNSPYKVGVDNTLTNIIIENQNLYNALKSQLDGKVVFTYDDNYQTLTIAKTEMTKVQELKINNLDILDISGLSNFTSLKKLDISNNGVTDISELQYLTNLVELDLHGNYISNITVLSNLINLQKLDISRNNITDTSTRKNMSNLANLTNLVELDASHNYFCYLDGIENLTSLTKLNLFDNNIKNISDLRYLTSLVELNLGENCENHVKMTGLDGLTTLVNLKSLNFSTNYTPEIIENISGLTSLEKLDISRGDLNDDYIKLGFSNLINLKEVNLFGNYIWSIKYFYPLTKLEDLNIQNNIFPNLDGILNNNELIWPNLRKLSIAGNKSLDLSSSTIQYLIDRSNQKILELNYEYLTDTSNLPHVDVNGVQYVTYDDFGARADGEYDDFIAIRNAHTFANKYGYEVRAGENKTYHIYKYNEEPAIIKTNVDWKNATFVIHDEKIEDYFGRYIHLFNINNVPNDDIINLNNPTLTLSKDAKKIVGIENEIESLNLKGYTKYLIYLQDADTRRFNRYKYGSDYAQQEVFLIDENGNILNDITWDYTKVTSLRIIPVNNYVTTIKGGNFLYNAFDSKSRSNAFKSYKSKYFSRNIYINNSTRVELNGIHQNLSEDVISGNFFGFIFSEVVAELKLENIVLFSRKQIDGGQSDYSLTMHNTVNFLGQNISSNDIYDNRRWGIIATKFTKDVVYDNCFINRVDAHEGVHNLTIKNTTMGCHGISVVGFGKLNIINTSVEGDVFMTLRTDYGLFWDGDIYIKDCTYKHTGKWAWKFLELDTTPLAEGFNFGYDVMFPNIYIENITFDNAGMSENEQLFLLPIWDKTSGENTPEGYWRNSTFMINGFKFINSLNTNPTLLLSTHNYGPMVGNYVFTNTELVDSQEVNLTSYFNNNQNLITSKNVMMTIKENATAKNTISIFKNNEKIVDGQDVSGTFQHVFDEEGKYKISLTTVDNKYGKYGNKEYEFEIKRESSIPPIDDDNNNNNENNTDNTNKQGNQGVRNNDLELNEKDQKVIYKITEGTYQKIFKGDNLAIKTNSNANKFENIEIDNVLLDKNSYIVLSNGSFLIVQNEYLSKLSEGEHKIKIIYEDGETSTVFYISKEVNTEEYEFRDDSDLKEIKSTSLKVVVGVLLFIFIAFFYSIKFIFNKFNKKNNSLK